MTSTRPPCPATAAIPDECMEIENADGGAHFICERTAPLIVKRESAGSAPTAKI